MAIMTLMMSLFDNLHHCIDCLVNFFPLGLKLVVLLYMMQSIDCQF
jgi:hypothetical protein